MPTSCIVVNWNGRDYLEACLQAVLAQDPPPDEVLVVDNASTDDSTALVRTRFPRVRVVAAGENVGPARARNLGVAAARHPRLLLLDNDVVLEPGALAQLERTMDGTGAAAVQARSVCAERPDVVHYDGADLHWLGVLVLHNWFAPLATAAPPRNPIGAVVALCVLVERRAFEEIGGFDERLFILFEDNDLSWRLRQRGFVLWLDAAARCRHRGGTAGLSVREAADPYPGRRVFLHSRNRWLVLLTCLHARSLLVLLPGELLYELVYLAFALSRGHGRDWWRGKVEVMRSPRAVLARRRQVQALRRVPDRWLLRGGALTLNRGLGERGAGAWLRRALDAGFALYWRCVRRLCG